MKRAAAGETLIPASRMAELLAGQRRRRREQADRARVGARLTPRERQILDMLQDGLNNRAIAARLGIRYVTVRSHVNSLLAKLDVHSTLEAVARAAELGLFEPPG